MSNIVDISTEAGVIRAAEDISDFLNTVQLEKLGQIGSVIPGLSEKLMALQLAVARHQRKSNGPL